MCWAALFPGFCLCDWRVTSIHCVSSFTVKVCRALFWSFILFWYSQRHKDLTCVSGACSNLESNVRSWGWVLHMSSYLKVAVQQIKIVWKGCRRENHFGPRSLARRTWLGSSWWLSRNHTYQRTNSLKEWSKAYSTYTYIHVHTVLG